MGLIVPKDISKRNKRTNVQRAADLVLFAEWVLRAWTLQQMADELAKVREYRLSTMQICNDLKKVDIEWRKTAALDVAKAKGILLRDIFRRRAEAIAGFERSKRQAVEVQKETALDQAQAAMETKGASGKKTVKRKGRDGDTKWLEEWHKADDMLARVVGVYAPQDVRLAGGDGGAVKHAVLVEVVRTGERLMQAGQVQALPEKAGELPEQEGQVVEAEAITTTGK